MKRSRRDIVQNQTKQENEGEMALDTDKIDDAALAILSLTLHYGNQVWKGVDWDITNLLHDKGLIEDPCQSRRGSSRDTAGRDQWS
ncbi:DUF6429 family protein [Pseudosulfitobacter pseudonitzschiae]|uniref:DUF6429 family protein n=1 Tax=Pseudosulfitobacter pseudonitzschiae TaxID=1402135 RepID=UPI003B769DFC